jgi:hypothetical protein
MLYESTESSSDEPPSPTEELGNLVHKLEAQVTNFLQSTKQLLHTLTSWSNGNATETEVSDAYVRLGYEFNLSCRSFSALGILVDDLGNVPELLRPILEEMLTLEASQDHLNRYLPPIRDIVIEVLNGLKKKQQLLRKLRDKDFDDTSKVSSNRQKVADNVNPETAHPSGSGNSDSTIRKQSWRIHMKYFFISAEHLFQTVTQWSHGEKTEEEVSDVFVRTGYEYNMACRGFKKDGVETGDVENAPDLLRSVLEETLSQEASEDALNLYLPRIREVVDNMSHSLEERERQLSNDHGNENDEAEQFDINFITEGTATPKETPTGEGKAK